MRLGTIVALWRYPVKSLGGERLATATVTPEGIEGDRRLAVVDTTTGKVLSAKTVPELLQLEARWAGDAVAIGDDASFAVTSADPDVDARLSARLGRPVRLEAPVPGRRATFDLALDPDDGREVREIQTPPGRFFDSRSTLHLLTTASAGGHDVRRFRPNLVVETIAGDAFPEDAWVGETLRLGATVDAGVRKATTRCVLITRPQPGLAKDSSLFRDLVRDREGNLGIYVDPRTSGDLAVGDAVERVA